MKVLPCRVCLKTENLRIDMLSNPLPTYFGSDVTLLEMFALVTEIAMQVGENSILCSNCQTRLIEAYNFRCEAQKATALLETVHVKEDTVKEETCYEDYESIDNVETFLKEEKPAEVKKEPRKKRTRSSVIPLPPATLNRFNCRYCFGRFKRYVSL